MGTLGEKPLHAVVKHYLAVDPAWHEQKIGRHVVDIYTGERIIEIQTRHFNKMRAKLTALLPQFPVTIVYPMPARKWLIWLDPESGELSKPRLSPRRGRFNDVFFELYRIKPFLNDPNLSIHILQIDLEEYRRLNGWSHDRKKGAWRNDRLPLSLEAELLISHPADYCQLLPAGLPESFTSADLAKAAQMSDRRAQTAINVLMSLGVVKICGKDGRRRLYVLVPGTKT
ncbi:MAG TPA: hypothetical protein DCM45_02410 [Clostridiales bacterium]|nr:hypothetical protein [Clostridiales bacterium]